ncbi:MULTISPECIES: outer membrane lipoprotein-sorting protein [Methylocaldum]|jgi:outer membrane lipoprotein-sorting protein|uniref:outer membrane lipoprotein-sorting protein n=1 Tax=unclassified Methylocaldum TaxID=2622260 RepID=UPI00098B9D3A|nr:MULTISPECIES: outer membrane lipoprotein-sorting protein [unclassified Methylocaldum]MBP1151175.1 outer membrane lipoprotein-sorting protein [Methylocaldum sp. RMAD-M]MDV3241700.1 outer membrane lipoprotein-sorting protein [Methylocaldum sp.]MVF21855.1 outer membrane lipoprotein-sorting protein [Methylocaldum sp. BRCS4]
MQTSIARRFAFAAAVTLLSNIILSGSLRADDVPDPAEIVAAADRIRFPQEGFQVDISITTTTSDSEPDVREYRVLSKGNENTVILTTAPAADRGQIMLMRGRDFWAFMPSVSQPIRLPLSQKLTGQVANGDLARANFTGDYNPKLSRIEEINGREYYVLELSAVDRGVTYPRVLYWVDKKNYNPYKAEFYTLSNRLFKTCRFQKFESMEGEVRPTQLVMENALKKDERSILDYRKMKLRDLPDKVFTKDYLKKVQE